MEEKVDKAVVSQIKINELKQKKNIFLNAIIQVI